MEQQEKSGRRTSGGRNQVAPVFNVRGQPPPTIRQAPALDDERDRIEMYKKNFQLPPKGRPASWLPPLPGRAAPGAAYLGGAPAGTNAIELAPGAKSWPKNLVMAPLAGQDRPFGKPLERRRKESEDGGAGSGEEGGASDEDSSSEGETESGSDEESGSGSDEEESGSESGGELSEMVSVDDPQDEVDAGRVQRYLAGFGDDLDSARGEGGGEKGDVVAPEESETWTDPGDLEKGAEDEGREEAYLERQGIWSDRDQAAVGGAGATASERHAGVLEQLEENAPFIQDSAAGLPSGVFPPYPMFRRYFALPWFLSRRTQWQTGADVREAGVRLRVKRDDGQFYDVGQVVAIERSPVMVHVLKMTLAGGRTPHVVFTKVAWDIMLGMGDLPISLLKERQWMDFRKGSLPKLLQPARQAAGSPPAWQNGIGPFVEAVQETLAMDVGDGYMKKQLNPKVVARRREELSGGGNPVHTLFQVLDTEGSGTLEGAELQILLKLLGEPCSSADVELSMAEIKGNMQFQGGEEGVAEGAAYLDKVTWPEFKRYMYTRGSSGHAGEVKLIVPLTEAKELALQFRDIDKDGSGQLEHKEIKAVAKYLQRFLGMTKKEVRGFVKKCGKEVDFTEFMWEAAELYIAARRMDDTREAFLTMDKDGYGEISREEIEVILRAGGESRQGIDFICGSLAPLMGEDGNISFDEFVTLVRLKQRRSHTKVVHDAKYRVRKAAIALMSSLTDIQEAFGKVDVNESGLIDEGELKTLLVKLRISFADEEFAGWMAAIQPERSRLKEDGTRENLISFFEFVEVLAGGVPDSKLGVLAHVLTVKRLQNVSTFLIFSDVSELEAMENLDNLPFLGRQAGRVLRRLTAKHADEVDKYLANVERERKKNGLEKVGGISKDQRKHMYYLSWFCEGKALLASAISGGISAVFEYYASVNYPVTCDPTVLSVDQLADCEMADRSVGSAQWFEYWSFVVIPTLFFAMLEIAFLYYDALSTSMRLTQYAGLRLFPVDPERAFLCNAICNEALELGHPTDTIFGLSPLEKNISKHRQAIRVCCLMLYKARSGLGGFIAKISAKRILSRSGAKALFPAAAIPVTMFWNYMVAHKVCRSVRCCAVGPVVIASVVDSLLRQYLELEDDERLLRSEVMREVPRRVQNAVMRVVAVALVKTGERHPNLEVLIKHLLFYFPDVMPERLYKLQDEGFLADSLLPIIKSEREKSLILRIFAFATIIDASVSKDEKLLVRRMLIGAGWKADLRSYKKAQNNFVQLKLVNEDILNLFEECKVVGDDGTLVDELRNFDVLSIHEKLSMWGNELLSLLTF